MGCAMQQFVDSFVHYLYEEAKDEKTIVSYRTTVIHFLEWYEQREGNVAIKETRPIDIKEYISYLKHQCKRKPATINKYIAALKVFFTYLNETGVIKDNPMTRIKMEKLQYAQNSNQTKWLNKEEQERFISYVELEKNEFKRLRNLAIVDLMLYAGLRVNEVASLELTDIQTKGNDIEIVVREGKGNKYASVLLVQKYSRNLRKWLKYRQNLEKSIHRESQRLFVSERSMFLTERAIQKMLAKYADLANMENITPHRFRHSFCKNLANAGTPIEIIRRLARHESIQTTAIYVDSSQEEQISALRKL
jgi:site-specific recombinase XerD